VDIALTHGVFCLDLPDPSGAHVRHNACARTHSHMRILTHTPDPSGVHVLVEILNCNALQNTVAATQLQHTATLQLV